jgi:hypothetical protein
MLVDLAERDINKEIFNSICDYISESLVSQIDSYNSIRLLTALLRNPKLTDNQYFKGAVLPQTIYNYFKALDTKINEELTDLGRKNIDSFTKLVNNMMKLLYRINKFKVSIDKNVISIEKLKDLYN